MSETIDRRKFIRQTGKAVIAAAAFGAGYYALGQRPDFPIVEAAAEVNANYAMTDISLAGKLAVSEGDNPREMARKVVGSLGGMEKFVSKNDKVVIKPNVAWDRTPVMAATTNPELIAELTTMVLEAGAAEVIVTDVTCHDARRTFARSGIKDAAEAAGAKVLLAAEEDFTEVDMQGELLHNWPVLKYFLEADKVINVPIVKNHTLSRATIGMKNLYGIIGGNRGQLHQKIDQSILDLAAFLRPTLVVVDAFRVLMRNGPVGGNVSDVKEAHTIYATVDQIAADSFGCQFLEIEPTQLGYLVMGDKAGLGKIDYSNLEIIRS